MGERPFVDSELSSSVVPFEPGSANSAKISLSSFSIGEYGACFERIRNRGSQQMTEQSKLLSNESVKQFNDAFVWW
eukprot:6447643-Heterocapsa_arctica.AAC.1